MSSVGTTVSCSECGKHLRGVPGLTPGHHIRKHKRPDGTPCRGHWSTNHRPVASKAVRS